MKWISTKDKLPETGVHVLTALNDAEIVIGWVSPYSAETRWEYMNGYLFPTHWQPLPDPPKKEKT